MKKQRRDIWRKITGNTRPSSSKSKVEPVISGGPSSAELCGPSDSFQSLIMNSNGQKQQSRVEMIVKGTKKGKQLIGPLRQLQFNPVMLASEMKKE